MSANVVVLEGLVNSDGTLVLDGKVDLPVGRVKVTVELTHDLSKDSFWQMMESIWAAQRARGHVPRTKEEIDAEIRELRDDWEERQESLERIQQECAEARRQRELSERSE